MDLSKQFDSVWLKPKLNVNAGDNIRFLNEGEIDENKRVNFVVGVIRGGEKIAEKKFTLNNTNFRAVASLYGMDSKKWIGKEMEVDIYKARNPKTNTLVDAIMLVVPAVHQDTDEVQEEEIQPEDLPF